MAIMLLDEDDKKINTKTTYPNPPPPTPTPRSR